MSLKHLSCVSLGGQTGGHVQKNQLSGRSGVQGLQGLWEGRAAVAMGGGAGPTWLSKVALVLLNGAHSAVLLVLCAHSGLIQGHT
jgi:hypothetical protein